MNEWRYSIKNTSPLPCPLPEAGEGARRIRKKREKAEIKLGRFIVIFLGKVERLVRALPRNDENFVDLF